MQNIYSSQTCFADFFLFWFVFNHKITISIKFKYTTEAAFTKIKIFSLFFFSCLGHNKK